MVNAFRFLQMNFCAKQITENGLREQLAPPTIPNDPPVTHHDDSIDCRNDVGDMNA